MENPENNSLVMAFANEVENMGNKDAATVRRLRFGIYGNVDPRKELWAGIVYFMGLEKRQPQWLPCYEEVAKWLGNNDGRGLICIGTSGLGKTVICQKVLPVLFSRHFGLEVLSVTANEMNARIDELLAYCRPSHIIIIDDLGTEPTIVYGRHPFSELVDTAERTGTLLIVTTNIRTTRDPDTRRNYPSIEARYGVPTLDRLRATTRVVVFKGESLRK